MLLVTFCYVSEVLTRIAELGLGRTLIGQNLAVFNFMNYGAVS